MFLKNNLRASRSIRARIVTFASYAVMTGVGSVLAPKTISAPNLVRNKHIDRTRPRSLSGGAHSRSVIGVAPSPRVGGGHGPQREPGPLHFSSPRNQDPSAQVRRMRSQAASDTPASNKIGALSSWAAQLQAYHVGAQPVRQVPLCQVKIV